MISLLKIYWANMNEKWESTRVRRHMGSYGHKSEWELPLTFTPNPLQAVCYCLSNHQCIEFTQWIPFFIRKAVRMEGSGSKTRSKWKSKLCKAGEPKWSGVCAESWSEGSSLPLRTAPRRLLVSGLGKKTCWFSWSSESDRVFSKNYFYKIVYLFFCLSRAL